MNSKVLLVITFLISNLFSFGQKESARFSNISIDKVGNVKWTVSYFQEDRGFEILIEQLKNGKWIHKGGLGESILGTTEKSLSKMIVTERSCQVKFHKGTNTYRLRMTFPDQITSEEFQLISNVSNDDGSLWIMDNIIYLDNVEQYEILDKVGSTLLKNEAKTIDISSLPQGAYFLYTKKLATSFNK